MCRRSCSWGAGSEASCGFGSLCGRRRILLTLDLRRRLQSSQLIACLAAAVFVALAGVSEAANNGFAISMADGAKEILFATPLAGQHMMDREPSRRLGVLARSFSGVIIYCDWDLDENRCGFTREFTSVRAVPDATRSYTY
eukprot:tig00020805_g14002.t1